MNIFQNGITERFLQLDKIIANLILVPKPPTRRIT
jgi:hypothetical protein